MAGKQREHKSKIYRLLRKRAYELETQRTPTKLDAIMAPTSLGEVVKVATDLDGEEAVGLAQQIHRTPVEIQYDLVREYVRKEVSPHTLKMLCAYNLEWFARNILAHHFTAELVPEFHGDSFNIIDQILSREIQRPVVIAGFPESGKTTMFSLLMPLHNVCVGRPVLIKNKTFDLIRRYHWHISSNIDIAQKNLQTVLKELEENDMLIELFGHLYKDRSGKDKQSRDWSARKATTANGVHMGAKGRLSKYRSDKFGQYRPDLGMVDDVQHDDAMESPKQRVKDMKWLTNVLLNRMASDVGNLVVTGNLIHEYSLMSEMIKYGEANKWTTRIYKVYDVDSNGDKKYLMPLRFGEEWETQKRDELMGRDSSFDQEYLQSTDVGEPELSFEDFKDVTKVELDSVLPNCEIYFAMDPAATSDKRADFTGIVGLAFDMSTGISYVLPMVNERMNIGLQVETAINVYLRYHPYAFGVEAVGYQKVLKPLIEMACMKQGITIQLVEIKQGRADKFSRIRRIFTPIKQGMMRFIAGDKTHATCKDQLVTISKGAQPMNDDIADALEMADRLRSEEMESRRANVSYAEAAF